MLFRSTTFYPNDPPPQIKIPFFDFSKESKFTQNQSIDENVDQEDSTKKDRDGPVIEGFTDLDDFLQFLEFLFEVVVGMICISLTIVVHIVYGLIGAFYMIQAFFFFIVGFITNLFKTFSDFNQVMNDISRCGMTWSKNLRYCILWYILEIIGYVAMMTFVWLPTTIVRIVTLGRVDLNSMFISVVGVKGSGYRDTDGRLIERDGILAIIGKKLKKVFGFDPTTNCIDRRNHYIYDEI